MKKDIFNGKIKQEHVTTTLISIIFGAITFLACAIFLLCMALFYDKIDSDGRALMFVVSVICFVCSVVHPIATLICVKSYPKHQKLAHILLKDYVFADIPQDDSAASQQDNNA